MRNFRQTYWTINKNWLAFEKFGQPLKPLTKIVLVPSGLMVVASATDVAIQKKTFGSGNTTLIFENDNINIRRLK